MDTILWITPEYKPTHTATCTRNCYSDVTTYRFDNKRHQLIQRASIIVICFTLFRNVRPCTILGYTLTNIPQKFNTDKEQRNENTHQVASRNRSRTSQVDLYLSSWNRGADEHGLEVGDAGRGMWGVRGLCGPGGSISAVAVLSTEAASGD